MFTHDASMQIFTVLRNKGVCGIFARGIYFKYDVAVVITASRRQRAFSIGELARLLIISNYGCHAVKHCLSSIIL